MERWMMGDPMLVLQRKQERAARTKQGKAEKAKQALQQLFKETPMTQDESQQTEELLMIWYEESLSYRPQLDVPSASVYAKDYRTSETRRSDSDMRDDADEKLNTIIAESVEACLDGLPGLQRSAVEIHCASRHSGCSVIRNPRMTIQEHHECYQAAKRALWPAFKQRELVR
jgi:hypothetical protein